MPWDSHLTSLSLCLFICSMDFLKYKNEDTPKELEKYIQ